MDDIKFEINKTYFCKSICDSNVKWEHTVTKRTDKSVWLGDKRFSVKTCYGEEIIYPNGKYAMCPVLHASRYKN